MKFSWLIENNLLFNFNKLFIGLIVSECMSDNKLKKIFAEHTKKRTSKVISIDDSIGTAEEYTITKDSDFMNELQSAFKKTNIKTFTDVVKKIISIGKLDSGMSYTSVNYVVREMLKSKPIRSELGKFAIRKYFLGKDNPKTDHDLEFRVRGIIYTIENDEPIFMINLKDSTQTKEPFWELSYKGGIEQDADITKSFQSGSKIYDFSIFTTAFRECEEEFPGSISEALVASHKTGSSAYVNLVDDKKNNSDIMYFTRKASRRDKKRTMILAMYVNILLPLNKREQPDKFKYTEHLDTKWVNYVELLSYLNKSKQLGMDKDLIFAKEFIPYYNFKNPRKVLSKENIYVNDKYKRLDTYLDDPTIILKGSKSAI